MDDNLKTLGDLFQNKYFIVPDYQRGYAWENKQFEDFYEDIIILQKKESHYTGLIALEEIPEEDMKKEYLSTLRWLEDDLGLKGYYIVDGQQRLTTCIIFINEIVNYINKIEGKTNEGEPCINKQTISGIKEQYLYRIDHESPSLIKSFKFGYLDNDMNSFFTNNIISNKGDQKIEKNLYTRNMENAKQFFYEKIDEQYKTNGKKALEDIFAKITQGLKFIVYNLKSNSNVYVSFESMNNRGKGLSNLELLKNRLIYLSTLYKNKEKEEKSIRTNINNTWKNIYKYLGKEEKLDDDEYLRTHWIIYFGYSRSKLDGETINYDNYLLGKYFSQKRLLETEQKQSNVEYDADREENEDELYGEEELKSALNKKLNIEGINKYVESLNDFIYQWYMVKIPNINVTDVKDKKIQILLKKIKRLNNSHFNPLITVVLYRNDISKDMKIKFLEVLERYIFIYFNLANHASNINDSYDYNLAHKLYRKQTTIEEIIEYYSKIDFIDKNGVIDISNEVLPKFKKLFINKKGFYSWGNALRYFLLEYDNSKITDTNQQFLSPEKVFNEKNSIEHIYPEKDKDVEWKKAFLNENDEQKQILKQSLGNMLVLNLSVNESLQNKPYSEKIQRYKTGSQSEIEVSNEYKEWNADSILERGLKLLKFMEERWEFQFKDEADKYKLLNLEFLAEDMASLEKDYKFEWDNKKINKANLPINEDFIHLIYEGFREIKLKNKSYDEVVNGISEKLNRDSKTSIEYYLDAIFAMYEGKEFKISINTDALEYFLKKIFDEFDKNIKENAINSVKMYIDYRKRNYNSKMKKDSEIYEKYKKILNEEEFA